MALVDSDLFLVQDAATKVSYRLTYENLTQDIQSDIDFDTKYVNIDGDNMTGILTLGPEGDIKITFDPTNGDGTFTGTLFTDVLQVETRIQGNEGLKLYGGLLAPTFIEIDTSGNTTFGGDTTFNADVQFNGEVTTAGDITVNGKLYAESARFATKIEGTNGLLIYSSSSVEKGVAIDSEGNVDIAGELTVTGDAFFGDVVGDLFTGAFAGDGSQLENLPVVPGLWQLNGDDLSPRSVDSNIVDIVNITASGTIEADKIDGGVYS